MILRSSREGFRFLYGLIDIIFLFCTSAYLICSRRSSTTSQSISVSRCQALQWSFVPPQASGGTGPGCFPHPTVLGSGCPCWQQGLHLLYLPPSAAAGCVGSMLNAAAVGRLSLKPFQRCGSLGTVLKVALHVYAAQGNISFFRGLC